MAELYGKATGVCKGKGGSMHMADAGVGMLGASGIVGGGIPLAAGAGLSIKMRGSNQVAVAFFGDGASNQGTFHESVNLAAIWHLPVIFVCENNQFAEATRVSDVMLVKNVADRAVAYGIPGVTVDGMNALDVYTAASEAVERARAGKGPTLLECVTYRYEGHGEGDNWTTYRSNEEVQEWRKRDPITAFKALMLQQNFAETTELGSIENWAQQEITAARVFAEKSPLPAPGDELKGVFAPTPPEEGLASPVETDRELTFKQAISEALVQALESDERVFLMGEDLRVFFGGGPFGVTPSAQFVDRFGKERIRDTPISEAAFIGAGTGAAITGMRPIVELALIDFFGVAMDQIYNQAGKIRYMFGEQAKVPIIIRTPYGAGFSFGPHHSQSLYSLFAHVPGIKVVVPSTPYDAKGLLLNALREENPVLFFEHKMLYPARGNVPKQKYTIPFGQARLRVKGDDVTIVGVGRAAELAVKAAERLRQDGISSEVLDPRTIVPLDKKAILESVKKTSRLVVVDEDYETCGFAAEVAAIVSSEGFDYLDSAIRRVTTPNVPIPFSHVMEAAVIPSEEKIIAAVTSLFK
jgi:pyruvate/2-oxoglutarate/acetoin dehydrogenase E1 component